MPMPCYVLVPDSVITVTPSPRRNSRVTDMAAVYEAEPSVA